MEMSTAISCGGPCARHEVMLERPSGYWKVLERMKSENLETLQDVIAEYAEGATQGNGAESRYHCCIREILMICNLSQPPCFPLVRTVSTFHPPTQFLMPCLTISGLFCAQSRTYATPLLLNTFGS